MSFVEGTFQENNYFCDLGYCCVLIKNFLRLYCQNDINKLSNFDFLRVIEDQEFGQVGKSGGRKKGALAQNTKIVKAIIFLLFADKLMLSYNNLFEKNSNYKIFLLNQFDILFSEDYSLRTIKKIFVEPNYKNFIDKISLFYQKVNSIGNFIILPDLDKIDFLSSTETNTVSRKIPYSDVFLNELEKVFVSAEDKNKSLANFVKENEVYFDSSFIDKNLYNFCVFNLLNDYVDRDGRLLNEFYPHYTFIDLVNNKNDEKFKALYVEYSTNYMCKVEDLIQKRAQRILSVLEKRLG